MAREFVPGELLVRVKAPISTSEYGVSAPSSSAILKFIEGHSVRSCTLLTEVPKSGRLTTTEAKSLALAIYRIQFSPTSDVTEVANLLMQSSDVVYAVPNMILRAFLTPNDPGFLTRQSTHLGLMKMTQAWDITTGKSDIVVGVIDTGVDYLHEDLKANIWTNSGEIANDGIDNDKNGFVDDVRGWNFVSDGTQKNDPADLNQHGTFVAGIVAGVANNGVGMTGVAPKCRIMPLRTGDKDGSFTQADIVSAVDYGVKMGAKVLNMSLGGTGAASDFQPLKDVIDKALAASVVVVVAAGNEATDIANSKYDGLPTYPANFSQVLTISATDSNGNFDSSYSNFGANVDVAAPGTSIYSTTATDQHNQYATGSGTSFAAPMTSGVAALILSANPNANVAQVLKSSAIDKGTAGVDTKYGSGLVNAYAALQASDSASPNITHTALTSVNMGRSITLSATVRDDVETTTLPSASVKYRFLPATSFSEIKMTKSGTQFSAVLPVATSINSQLDYYIVAQDAVPHTVNLPSSAPTSFFSAAVIDNESPVISTGLVSNDFFSTAKTITLNISDNGTLDLSSLRVQVDPSTKAAAAIQKTYVVGDSGVVFNNPVLTLTPTLMGLSNTPIRMTISVSDVSKNSTQLALDLVGTTPGSFGSTVFSLTGPTSTDPILPMPNPFNPNTDSQIKLCFQVSHDSDILIKVYTLSLASVTTLSQSVPAGYNEIVWNGRDDSGQKLPGGVYLMMVKATSSGQTLIRHTKIAVVY